MKHSALGTYLVAATTLLGAAICALADNDDGACDSNSGSGNSNNNSCGGGYTNDNSNCGGGGANDGSCSSGYNNNNNNNNNCGGDGNENNGCGWGYGGDGSGNGGSNNNGGNGNNQPNFTIPQGKITVTTPDPTTMKWSGQTKLHDQMLSSNTYTAQGQISFPPNANIDPNGTVGITRLFQSRGPNNALGAPSFMAPILASDAPTLLLHFFNISTINYGPYEPDQSVFSATGLPANSVYGVETIELVYQSGAGSKTVLDYQEIDVYQPATSQLDDYSTQQAVKPASGSSAYTYTGNAPRIATTISYIYPGSTTWVSIYPQNSPQNAVTVPTSVANAAGGDASNRGPSPFYVDTGNFVSGSGTYVVQVNEQMPNGTTVTVGKTPFNFSPTVLATASVGVTK